MRTFKFLSLICLAGLVNTKVNAQQVPSWGIGPFVRPAGVSPLIKPDTTAGFLDPMSKKQVKWEANDTFNPAAAVKDGKVYILYRAEDRSGVGISQRTSRIGLAQSKDGIHVTKASKPVLFPAEDAQKQYEWTGGCEDPRVAVTADGTYVILYTEWNHKVPRLAVATSKDLIKWHKFGPAFRQAYNGRFFDKASKSASIVTKVINGKQVITKVNGKYMMYWGEERVYAATSTDLVNWAPLTNADGSLTVLFEPRKGFFDSVFTECGPPAIITSKGIVLLYNGKNSAEDGDKNYAPNAYCAGQALFSLNEPTKVIARMDKPFLVPQEAFEKSGQYPAGTVFIEGMAYLNDKWFLYYGCADSRVAVAVYDTTVKK